VVEVTDTSVAKTITFKMKYALEGKEFTSSDLQIEVKALPCEATNTVDFDMPENEKYVPKDGTTKVPINVPIASLKLWDSTKEKGIMFADVNDPNYSSNMAYPELSSRAYHP
jgi:hypothetical protein